MAEVATPKALDPETERLVKEIGLPPCPTIVLEFMREMRRDEPDFRRLMGLISSDVALSAAVLKTANSPFYGLRTKATTAQDACTFLGLRPTAYLISGLLLKRAFPVQNTKLIEGFWRTSATLATYASALAGVIGGIDRQTAYTFAQFRDCGKAALLARHADYAALFEKPAVSLDVATAVFHASILDEENERYRMNHARIGALLAHSWYLPDALCDAILHHHDWMRIHTGDLTLERPVLRLVSVVLLAEQLHAMKATGKPCAEWAIARAAVSEALGVDEENLDRFQSVIAEAGSAVAIV